MVKIKRVVRDILTIKRGVQKILKNEKVRRKENLQHIVETKRAAHKMGEMKTRGSRDCKNQEQSSEEDEIPEELSSHNGIHEKIANM